MKIKILYEEDIKNGVPHYTTVEIPDGDYMTVLEQDYQMRLANAPDDKKRPGKTVPLHAGAV